MADKAVITLKHLQTIKKGSDDLGLNCAFDLDEDERPSVGDVGVGVDVDALSFFAISLIFSLLELCQFMASSLFWEGCGFGEWECDAFLLPPASQFSKEEAV